MRATSQAVLNAAIDQVDLEHWMFSLTDEEYRAAARGHHAAGTLVAEGVRGTVNVESVGGNMCVQRYRAVRTDPTRTELYSAQSRVWLFHLVPVTVQVRWIMEATPRDAETSTLTCTVELTTSPLLRRLAQAAALPFFLQRHVAEETIGFARDMNHKLAGSRV